MWWSSHFRNAPSGRENEMQGRIQIVGRLPVELNRRVRAAAKRRKVSLNAFLIDTLTQALGARRVAAPKEAR
jgi:predicted HicB family RNase H-like nuclease